MKEVDGDYLQGRIPPCYMREDGILLANSGWWNEGDFEGDFVLLDNKSEEEISCCLREGESPFPKDWILISFLRYPRQTQERDGFLPLPDVKFFSKESLAFPDHLRYVHNSINGSQWGKAFRTHRSPYIRSEQRQQERSPQPMDLVLFSLLRRLYNPLVVNKSCDLRFNAADEDTWGDPSPGQRLLVTPKEFIHFQPYRRYTLYSILNFSPSMLSPFKLQFILYQILRKVADIHDKGLSTGDICLSDIFTDDTLQICIRPDINANLVPALPLSPPPIQTKKKIEKGPSSPLLNKALKDWSRGRLSNYEYLMILNTLSGRNVHNPNYYPILPWVRDFSSPTGGWRDLSKSKFRLNKGDVQLDLTYNSLLNEPPGGGSSSTYSSKKQVLSAPHHVSDLLSEITYYVYRARRTSKEVLCKYVRSRWVPHEYPSSLQRLQEWTPDECIPDFFTDPSLFVSIHEDLGDLELPPWTSDPQEFIQWHMESLESNYVSERLHHWIDLTFGYKLTGSAAVRAKNVCLHLADEHSDLRDSGVVQLFNSPHPTREYQSKSPYFSQTSPSLDIFLSFNAPNQSSNGSTNSNNSDEGEATAEGVKKIHLPNDYDPLAALSEIESNFSFLTKSYASALNNAQEKSPPSEESHPFEEQGVGSISYRKSVRDVINLGVLMLELFVYKKFSCLGASPSLESRHSIAKYILVNESFSIPLSIREAVSCLLNRGEFTLDGKECFPIANPRNGTPSPSAKQFLIPFISSDLLPFSPHFEVFVDTSGNISMIDEFIAQNMADLTGTQVEELHQVKVKLVASNIIPLLDQLKKEELSIFLPTIQKLFRDPHTTIVSSWYLFDPLGKALGPVESMKFFLEPLINIFESGSHTSKHLKLYHRTFLLSLVLRLGTKNFLEHFISYVIEAVGGYKDFRINDFKKGLQEDNSCCWREEDKAAATTMEEHVPETLFTLEHVKSSEEDSEGDEEDEEDLRLQRGVSLKIPSSYDLNDVLREAEEESTGGGNGGCEGATNEGGNISQVAGESVVWLSHRLGPVLSARYLTRNLLKMLNLCFMGRECAERLPSNDRKSRISNFKTRGDANAENVLECLGAIADLYGEQMIILQYLPYARDLIGNCIKKRLNGNMEGGLLGVLALIHYILPFLSDSLIMSELQDNLLSRVLFPALQLCGSKVVSFPGGPEVRGLLAFRLLDVVYLIGLRIGEEMSRAHLTPLCSAFFSLFDSEESDLSPELAYTGYTGFYHLLGKDHLRSAIPNVDTIQTLCASVSLSLKPINFSHLRISSGEDRESPASLGNKLSTYVGEVDTRLNDFVRSMISRESPNSSRHLRGNWLAYWEHEHGRSESPFSLKQIRLQSFSGHSASVKALYVLDNENSFLSGSRDKTVKVWSLRSQHDEASLVVPQWTYGLHKKSVFAVSYLEGQNLVASCDSNIHIWDPFVGSSIHQFNGLPNVTSLIHLPSPSTNLLAATMDSLVHLVDVRCKVTTDLKVCIGSAGLVKCMCIQSDGHTATIGHSSGYISNLDLRTGKIRHTRKGHEGEILVLGALNTGSKFVSTSLDQTVNLWDKDAKLIGSLPGPQEPVHCVVTSTGGDTEDIITGSTANRIGVRHGTSPESPFTSNKLRSDILKGNLTSLKLLSMNSLLLLGTDTGSIQLIC